MRKELRIKNQISELERVAQFIEEIGEELIQRAEELIADTEGIKDIDIWVNIPSLSDDPCCVPTIQVTTNVYPKRVNIYKLTEEAMKMADEALDAGPAV